MITLFRVFPSERTRIDVDPNEPLGWGIQFPSNLVFVDWNRDVFDEADRLDFAHISQYGSLDDVEQGTGGDVVVEYEFEWGP